MKKYNILLIIGIVFSAAALYAQDAVHADKAIQEIADYLDNRLPVNAVVAILHIQSDNQDLSSYIISGLINALIDRKNLIPVDRENIDVIKKELALHLTGDVSDETAQAIGKMLGAGTIITGTIVTMNRMYRLEIKAIAAETTAIQGAVHKNILNDKTLKKITGNTTGFPVSIGGGIHIGGIFSEGIHENKGRENVPSLGYYLYDYTITETNSRNSFAIGGFVFLDLKYAEINMSMYNGSGQMQWLQEKEYRYDSKVVLTEDSKKSTGHFSTTMLAIGVLAKYPFYLHKIALYPLLGADYQLWLRYHEEGKNIPGDLSAHNTVWFKIGGGMDYYVARSLFLRTELLWGVKLPDKNERNDSSVWFTHSPSAHIGIGYVFNRR